MNRKGFSPGIMVAILVGLFFIGIVVVGFGPKIAGYVNEKFFGGFFVPKPPTPPGTVTGPGSNVLVLSTNYDEAVKELVDTSLACWQAWQGGYKGICAKVVPADRISKAITRDDFVSALYSSSDIRGAYIVQNYAYRWKLDVQIGSGSRLFFMCVIVPSGPIPLTGPAGVLFLTRNEADCKVSL